MCLSIQIEGSYIIRTKLKKTQTNPPSVVCRFFRRTLSPLSVTVERGAIVVELTNSTEEESESKVVA